MECLVCRKVANTDGLAFCGVAICAHCEGELMSVSVDRPEYDAFVHALSRMWQERFSASRDRRLRNGDHM